VGKETLYVSSFDSTTIGWAVTSTTPYLDANDTSYVSGKNTLNCMIGTFHFANTTIASYSSITAMTLYVRWKDNNPEDGAEFIYYGSSTIALGTVVVGDSTSYVDTPTNVLAKYTSLAELNAAKGVLKKTTTAGTVTVSQAYIINTWSDAAVNATIASTFRLKTNLRQLKYNTYSIKCKLLNNRNVTLTSKSGVIAYITSYINFLHRLYIKCTKWVNKHMLFKCEPFFFTGAMASPDWVLVNTPTTISTTFSADIGGLYSGQIELYNNFYGYYSTLDAEVMENPMGSGTYTVTAAYTPSSLGLFNSRAVVRG
jgi:hypothetical protein